MTEMSRARGVRRAHSRERIGTWFTIAVLTVALILVYVSNRRLVSCVNDYFEKSQATQRVRAAALEKNDEAVDTMVGSVLLSKSSEETRIALEAFRETRRQVEETRRKNPVPAPPDHC